MRSIHKILMLASENDRLPGAKVGGVGDVIRDLPKALAREQCQVDVVIPSYGFLARLPNLQKMAQVDVPFAHTHYSVELFKSHDAEEAVDNYIIHHPAFASCGEKIYCSDPDSRPFARDASKYALFCRAAAELLLQGHLMRPNIIHCHDWHSALLLVLIKFDPMFKSLKDIGTVYTIHNLALQGVRPYANDPSSLASWYPDIKVDHKLVGDPHAGNCINPMRAGIVLADKVHTVSPGYVEEIQLASDHAAGLYGGEGLEHDLRLRAQKGDLVGILNGCEYPKKTKKEKPTRKKIVTMAKQELLLWASNEGILPSAHWIAEKRLEEWLTQKKIGMNLVSIGRITEQKVRILLYEYDGKSTLEHLLDKLDENNIFIMVGTGDQALENKLTKICALRNNFIFICGYAQALSDSLYDFGDLFVMPSSFEPCGISQMLAMRSGQPCLVNAVGGLKNTVEDNKNGFVFSGRNIQEQAQALVARFEETQALYAQNLVLWKRLSAVAASMNFSWSKSAKAYINQIYNLISA